MNYTDTVCGDSFGAHWSTTRQTLTMTSQSPNIRSLMLLEMASFLSNSELALLLPVRVEAVQLGGVHSMMRGATGFGSSAGQRLRRRRAQLVLLRATESSQRQFGSSHLHHS